MTSIGVMKNTNIERSKNMEHITKQKFINIAKNGIYFCGVFEDQTLNQLKDYTSHAEHNLYHMSTKFIPCAPIFNQEYVIYKNNGFVLVCDKMDRKYFNARIYATLEPLSRILDGDEKNPANWQTQCKECFQWFADRDLEDGVCCDCEYQEIPEK